MSAEEAYEKGIEDAETVASVAGPTEKNPTGNRMYVRTQNFGSSEEEMRFLQRNGVRHKAAIFLSMRALDGKLMIWSENERNTNHTV